MVPVISFMVVSVLLVIPVLGLVIAIAARSRGLQVELELKLASDRLAQALRELAQLHQEVRGARQADQEGDPVQAPAVAAAPESAQVAEHVAPAPAPPVEPAAEQASGPLADSPAPAAPAANAASPGAPGAAAQAGVVEEGVPAATPGETSAEARVAAAPAVAPSPQAGPVSQPPPPRPVQAPPPPRPVQAPPPPPRPAQPPPPPPRSPSFDWENVIGVKLFSWVAGIALVIAAVLFLRYSIERGWLAAPIRMAIGLATGVALLLLCELRLAQRYRVTANAMDGAAIAVLFATFFAGHAIWHLVPALATFALMALVTAVAVLLSIRRDSAFIALLGLAGGFATPALLSSGLDRPVGLFGYLLLLNAGLGWVARRRGWSVLTALSILLTAVYQWVWVSSRLTPGQIPLAVAIFLVFPVLAYATLLLRRRPAGAGSPEDGVLNGAAGASGLLPIAFAVYLAAVPSYGEHFVLLFSFLLLLDLGLLAVALWRGPAALHLGAGLGTLLVFAVFLIASYRPEAWPGMLALIALFVALYAGAPLLADKLARPLGTAGEQATLVGPFLLFTFPLLAYIEQECAHPGLLFAALAVLLALVAAVAALRSRLAIYLVGGVMAVIAEVVWEARHLSADELGPGLVMIVGLSLLYLAIPILARRLGRPLPSGEHAAYLMLTGPALLLAVALQTELAIPAWPLLAAVGVLVLAAATGALELATPGLHVGMLVGASAVLLAFTATVEESPWPLVAVLASVALGAFAVAWVLVASRKLSGYQAVPMRLYAGGAVSALVAAHLVTIGAAAAEGAPEFSVIIFAHLAFVSAILWLAARFEWHRLALLAVLPTAWAAAAWGRSGAEGGFTALWWPRLELAIAMLAPFLVYPWALGRRAGGRVSPYGAAVLASVPCFFLGRQCFIDGNLRSVIFVLPVALGGAMLLLLHRALHVDPPGELQLNRLALVAGAALAFITAAIPLQLEKEWITIGWALEGAALAWLYTRIRHRGVLYTSAGLLGVVFVRLVMNPAVLSYHPRAATPVLNWYLYTYLVASAATFLAAWWLARTDDSLGKGSGPRLSRLLPALGVVLLFVLLNIEIADCFSEGSRLAFSFTGGESLAQNLSYTLGWAFFAIGLLVAGVAAGSKATRVAAIGLLAVTVLKAFLFDLSRLSGLYRIASFVGLAVSLAAVAVLLQRFVLLREEKEP
jgi:uncharacterized membrane protein